MHVGYERHDGCGNQREGYQPGSGQGEHHLPV